MINWDVYIILGVMRSFTHHVLFYGLQLVIKRRGDNKKTDGSINGVV